MRKITLIFLLLSWSIAANAELRLPQILGDNMVLQQSSDARLWGWAEPLSKIKVKTSWSKTTYETLSDSLGAWLLSIKTPEASFTPHTLTIQEQGSKPVTLNNILIGEVWFCSGQSNMEMPLEGFVSQPVEGGAETILHSHEYKYVRVATIPRRTALTPQESVDGKWQISEPKSARKFSATAFYFAAELQRMLNVPVGVIVCCWGGTHIEGWMPEWLLREKGVADLEKYMTEESRKNGRYVVMYNAMLHPLRHYTIKGFIWYQGCSNVPKYQYYADFQTSMVKHWRDLWGLGELPFYYVEIAPYRYADRYGDMASMLLREQQQLALQSIPSSGMISTVDLVYPYEEKIIHPSQKRPVGDRLAWLALEKTYRMAGVRGQSSQFKSMEQTEQGKVLLSFTNTPDGFATQGEINGFYVAGADRVFHPAKARVLRFERQIELSSPNVERIEAVRYGFDRFAPCTTLHNMRGLPIMPFRTDDWNQ